jgi:DNA-damage-inducible protein D
MTSQNNSLTIFENCKIRRTYNSEEEKWYFALEDIIFALTESVNPKDYINKMKKRDAELNKGWGQIVHTLAIETEGGKQKMRCTNTEGALRIIQSITSPRAEPFKQWLAKVGFERIQEINDPELSLNRARENWKKKGRSQKWIDQRIMGQETHGKLTDYWSENGVEKGKEYGILTNIIHEEWSELSIRKHKVKKGLTSKSQNLRDHMTESELLFTALAEMSTRQIAETMEAKGLEENKIPAKKGGNIAKNARLELESKTGKKVVTKDNFLPTKSTNPKLISTND